MIVAGPHAVPLLPLNLHPAAESHPGIPGARQRLFCAASVLCGPRDVRARVCVEALLSVCVLCRVRVVCVHVCLSVLVCSVSVSVSVSVPVSGVCVCVLPG